MSEAQKQDAKKDFKPTPSFANMIKEFEDKQVKDLTPDAGIPDFSAGDDIRVNVRVVEGEKERIQAFEGVCLARSNDGLNSSFTVRKISYGEGVERVFPLYSPRIASIEVIRYGRVRRSKLYYLRNLRGKAARITERTTGRGMINGRSVNAVSKKKK